ncbi:MAG: hypothetical protein BGP25_06460 [Lysobacterales bacterium 63-13]|nr:MAG: hypothetical protein BGP25_06460 [Xanthomonadales bacterium 63-13]
MIDPYSFELTSTLLSLAATYLTGKESRGEALDAATFRDWLEHEAFPLLLKQADQTLASVISMKADQHEQLQELLNKVHLIYAAVVTPHPSVTIAKLQNLDRALMLYMFDRASDEGPFQHFESGDLESALGASSAKIISSVRWLEENGWIVVAEFSGGWSCSPTAAGLDFTWTATDPSAPEAIERLRRALPDRTASERLETLANAAEIPIGLAYSKVKIWADQGLLIFEDSVWPPSEGLVHGVQESLRRGWPDAPSHSH